MHRTGDRVDVGWASAHQSHHSTNSANLTGAGKPMPSEGGGIGGGGGLKPTLQPPPPKKNKKKPNLTKSDKKCQPETDKNCHN
ncbi:hypothetical protein JY06_01420 [Neisseria meningitidis]|nr:hypothetical protein CQR35_11905 [Neisseria meningitidis]ELK86397.1 hypothetical protein NMNM586_0200 [Neisseria meningitidis NM586]ATL35758.1 hypothetical protein CQR34_01820 [Neisseria meningitidis]KGI98932.1 hypothetical protein JH16_01990 [Neisseria meningitidis]RNK09296.1 hypothetical protein COI27_02185 [Neisseria meningitidis]